MLDDIFEVSETSKLKEADWEKGANHVNPIIREIYADYKARYTPNLPNAVPVDFTFDDLAKIMRMTGSRLQSNR